MDVEKGFQKGGDLLRENGLKVESLAIIDSLEDGKIKGFDADIMDEIAKR